MSNKEFDTEMGSVIRQHRKERGWTMEQLGRQLGFSYQMIQKYESGQSSASAELVSRIAAIFGVTVTEMYERAGVVSSTNPPSEAESAGFLACRYVSRIKDEVLRNSIVDFARKLAYQGAAS